jgi:hypothetical protein
MGEENGGINFILGLAMGVGCGLLVGVVVFATLVYFAPGFLGVRHSDKMAGATKGAVIGGRAKSSPFLR